MDVDIDGNRWLVEADSQGEGRDFGTDAPESSKPFDRVRHASPVFVHNLLGQALEVAGFRLGKSSSVQQFHKRPFVQVG